VSARGVRLRYSEKDDAALDDLSFEVKPGELVAITGGSGSGKTTLLKAMLGLYRPEVGAMLLDGFDLRQLDPFELRRQIGYAPQVPDFYSGSILENLRLGNPIASAEDARRALEEVGGWEGVHAFPHGLDAVIAPRGAAAPPQSLAPKLSLARLILHDGRILLIDELPNVLMAGTVGAQVKSLLSEWKGRKTVFIVTQREDVTALADVVVTLSRHGRPRSLTRRSATPHVRAAA
jgi:ABC-type bacteriocin/lantibiotic exporter with double-glycine peptidase domain